MLDIPTKVLEKVEEGRVDGEHPPERAVRACVVAAYALKGEIEAIADQGVIPRRWLMVCCSFPST